MKKVLIVALGILVFQGLVGQEERRNKTEGGFVFSDVKEVGATSVKNQYKSGTCWSYSGISFFESELIRMGLDSVNLSEMWIVRKAYEMKAERYVRAHGKAQFGPGGQFHDVVDVAKRYGILTEEQYGGQPAYYGKPVHAELDAMASAMLGVVVKNHNRTLSPNWKKAYSGMLDAYLGELPQDAKPMEYANSLGIDWDKYVELTSFNHIPFYEKSELLIPDNWTHGQYYNLPVDDLYKATHQAIQSGFSVAWDADVSERGFSFKNGVAIFPITPWNQMPKAQRDTLFNEPSIEKLVSQEERQEMYDSYETKDDHLMHIVGTCKDQNGTNYFIVKNSWGTNRNDCGGYIYVSEAYFRAKTIAVMIHSNGIEKGIAKKLKF